MVSVFVISIPIPIPIPIPVPILAPPDPPCEQLLAVEVVGMLGCVHGSGHGLHASHPIVVPVTVPLALLFCCQSSSPPPPPPHLLLTPSCLVSS
jgi:hypothetical protein